jgi:hypothetical protein
MILFLKVNKKAKKYLISPSSTDKNAEIVRPDVMIGVRTPMPSFYVYEFMMALLSRLSKKRA